MEPQWHRHNELVAGHNLHDYDGLPDEIGAVLSVTESRGYLLNHGRSRYAFLINVQVHNAKTASATTVAIADKAKVYILIMPHKRVPCLATLLTLMFHCARNSFGALQDTIGLCLTL